MSPTLAQPRTGARGGWIVWLAIAAIIPGISVGGWVPSALAGAVPGCNSTWPVVAHRAGGAVVELPAGGTLPVACATETGYASSESTIAVTRNGAIIYSPAETENSMARSLDNG